MKKHNVRSLVVLLILGFTSVSPLIFAKDLPEEVKIIKQRFADKNEIVEITKEYEKILIEKGKERLFSNVLDVPTSSQYFLLVDRNPKAQIATLSFFDAEDKSINIIGAEKVSTGNPKKIGYYETPIGVFKNLPDNMSYRALGTKNKKGWRAFGVKGSRVWDLGWQKSRNFKNPDINIRMLIHATDPDHGEKRLGTQDSKGCIRVSAKLNHFLDYHGILDAEFEKTIKRKYVLLKDRETISFAGNTIVVVDSSQ
jgi:hypothetical protein